MSTAEETPSLERGGWKLDPDGALIEFVTRTFWGVVPVKGTFTEFQGSWDLSASPAITLVLGAASLSTKNAKRDEHLRSDDFFAAETHPEVRFESNDVHVHGDHLHVSGTLSAAGKSIEIEPAAHIHPVDGGFEIDAVARVPHRDLGMIANPGGMIQSKSWLHVSGKLVPA